MKKLSLLIIILCFSLPVFALDLDQVSALTFDLGGPSTFTLAEMELGLRHEYHTVLLSAGFGMKIGNGAIPLGINYRFGGKHQLELGYNYVLVSPSKRHVNALKIGYRLNFGRGFFHAYVSPYSEMFGAIKPWFGLGFGWYPTNGDDKPYLKR